MSQILRHFGILIAESKCFIVHSNLKEIQSLKVAICNRLIDDLVNREPLVRFSEVYSKAGEGGTPETSKSEYYENGNIPFIKIDDLSNEVTKKV